MATILLLGAGAGLIIAVWIVLELLLGGPCV